MNSFATMGMNTFMEGVESGMAPEAAAEAAGGHQGDRLAVGLSSCVDGGAAGPGRLARDRAPRAAAQG